MGRWGGGPPGTQGAHLALSSAGTCHWVKKCGSPLCCPVSLLSLLALLYSLPVLSLPSSPGLFPRVFSSVLALGSELSTPCRGEACSGVDVDSPSLTGLWGPGSGRGTCPEVGEKVHLLGEGKVRWLSGDSRRSLQLQWVGRWESAKAGDATCPSPQPQGCKAVGGGCLARLPSREEASQEVQWCVGV